MSDQSDDDEDSEGQESVDSPFDGVETPVGGTDTVSEADQTAAQMSQAAGEQIDWNTLVENLEDVTNLIREYFEQSRENKRVENERKRSYFKHQQRIVIIAAVTFLLVISISAWMTFSNALSGDAFTFVLGTLFGAILTFLQNMIGQSNEENQS